MLKPKPVPLANAKNWNDRLLNRELARVFRGAYVERLVLHSAPERWVYAYREPQQPHRRSETFHETESGAWDSGPFYLDNPLSLLLDSTGAIAASAYHSDGSTHPIQLSDLPVHLSRLDHLPIIPLLSYSTTPDRLRLAYLDALASLLVTLQTPAVCRKLALAMLATAGRISTDTRPTRPKKTRRWGGDRISHQRSGGEHD